MDPYPAGLLVPIPAWGLPEFGLREALRVPGMRKSVWGILVFRIGVVLGLYAFAWWAASSQAQPSSTLAVTLAGMGVMLGITIPAHPFIKVAPRVEVVGVFPDRLQLFYATGMIGTRAWPGVSLLVDKSSVIAVTGSTALFRGSIGSFGDGLDYLVRTAQAGGATVAAP